MLDIILVPLFGVWKPFVISKNIDEYLSLVRFILTQANPQVSGVHWESGNVEKLEVEDTCARATSGGRQVPRWVAEVRIDDIAEDIKFNFARFLFGRLVGVQRVSIGTRVFRWRLFSPL